MQRGGQGVAESDYDPGGAVILVQWEDAGVWVDARELDEQQARIGTSPGVDGLPGITDDGQIVVALDDLT